VGGGEDYDFIFDLLGAA